MLDTLWDINVDLIVLCDAAQSAVLLRQVVSSSVSVRGLR